MKTVCARWSYSHADQATRPRVASSAARLPHRSRIATDRSVLETTTSWATRASTLRGRASAVITVRQAPPDPIDDGQQSMLVAGLVALAADVGIVEYVPDDCALMQQRLRSLADADVRLCLCSGPSRRSHESVRGALQAIADHEVAPFNDMVRTVSTAHPSLAWLDHAYAIKIGRMLAVALTAPPDALAYGWDIVHPLLAHMLAMIDGESPE